MDRQDFWGGLRRSAIIDQQLWYLGRDIAGPLGNALLAYGFDRRRSASGTGSSAYLLPLMTRAADAPLGLSGMLICWGFGMYAGEVRPADGRPMPIAPTCPTPGGQTSASPLAGAMIERFRDTPGLVRVPVSPDLHQVSSLPRTHPPGTPADRAFAASAIRAIALTMAAYERWAIATLGSAHREAALHDAPRHKRHRFTRVPELSAVWEHVMQTSLPSHASANQIRSAPLCTNAQVS